VPAHTWLKVECLGPLPKSIQQTYPIIAQEWPAGWERMNSCTLEEYGVCNTPDDAQQDDYQCFIWIPVRKQTP